MSCLSVVCLYASLAVGYRDDALAFEIRDGRPTTEYAAASPFGSGQFGVRHESGLYLEYQHASSMATGKDNGLNVWWIGYRKEWGVTF